MGVHITLEGRAIFIVHFENQNKEMDFRYFVYNVLLLGIYCLWNIYRDVGH